MEFQSGGNRLADAVNGLLHDFHRFAALGEAVNLQEYAFEVIEKFCYPVLVSYISVDKRQVRDAAHGFAVLFIKDLYMGNEWDEDQRWDPWAGCLEHIWLPESFHRDEVTGRANYDIKEMDTAYFLQEISAWMEHNQISKEEIAGFCQSHAKANVIEVCRVYAGHHCFGETEDRYFIAEFGCGYD